MPDIKVLGLKKRLKNGLGRELIIHLKKTLNREFILMPEPAGEME